MNLYEVSASKDIKLMRPKNLMQKKFPSLRVLKKDAEKAKQFLRENGLHAQARPFSREEHIFFPLARQPREPELERLGCEYLISEESFQETQQKKDLKEFLEGKLSLEEQEKLFRSYSIVGDIAIVEIPEGLEPKERIIGEALLGLHKNVRTVVKEAGERTQIYRIRKVEVIAGENRTETIHREHGCSFKVDLNKTFFSGRLSAERKRIALQVREGEVIGALFAGVGPFPIVIMKHSKARIAYAIELNPDAVAMLKENLALNRMHGKIEVIQGDVREEADRLIQKFDRVLMPLPKGGEDFLPSALKTVKHGGIIHFYQFAEKDSPFEEAVKMVKLRCAEQGRKCLILGENVIRSYSPKIVQVVIDFKVL